MGLLKLPGYNSNVSLFGFHETFPYRSFQLKVIPPVFPLEADRQLQRLKIVFQIGLTIVFGRPLVLLASAVGRNQNLSSVKIR